MENIEKLDLYELSQFEMVEIVGGDRFMRDVGWCFGRLCRFISNLTIDESAIMCV